MGARRRQATRVKARVKEAFTLVLAGACCGPGRALWKLLPPDPVLVCIRAQDPWDMTKALREMQGKYVGNRPIKVRHAAAQS